MEKPHTEAACRGKMLPIRDTLDLLSGKWKLLIIFHLTDGAKRFKELQREVRGITPRMLSKELKELEQHQLVVREAFDTAPITVIYSLTEHAESLGPLIKALFDWGAQHREKILREAVEHDVNTPSLR